MEHVEDWEELKKIDMLPKQVKKKDWERLGRPKPPGNVFTFYLNSIKQDGVELKVSGFHLFPETIDVSLV